jgi:hypothetical protein
LTKNDVKVVLGMAARGDRNHDIAAWFGVNQGRIAEAKAGEYGTLEAAPANELPPQGAPGIKGRRLRGAAEQASELLSEGDAAKALAHLQQALAKYDANEG